MITKDITEHFKMTPKEIKRKFTLSRKKGIGGLEDLRKLTADRIREGRAFNLRDYRMFWAMDKIFDAPFAQVTPTMAKALFDRIDDDAQMSNEQYDQAKKMGLTQFISTTKKDNGETCHCVDLPTFFKIVIPLAKSYLTTRVAKLWDNRDLYPFLKYEPIWNTRKNRTRAEILTSAIEQQAQELGYRDVAKQWILNAMMYGTSIMFPREEYFIEREMEFDDSGKRPVTKIKKSGIRYNIPHPTRVFYDRNFRLGTMNTDSGCEFAGYWRVVRYGDLRRSKIYWNTSKLSMFRENLFYQNQIFFKEVYPCTMEFPNWPGAAAGGAGEMDRESSVNFYTSSHDDKAVVLTDVYQKLVPKDWGISDYKYPVWFRFVMANDYDPIYIAPVCYNPLLYIGYDAMEERHRNSSLLLEILPFQDHMSNLLTQQILTAKTNLAKAIFVDTDIVPQNILDQLENQGERFYRKLMFIPFQGRKMTHGQQNVRAAFHPVNFPVTSTSELIGTFRTMLDVLERVLVFSAQEVASAASHEQTAEEIITTRGSVNTRVKFTDSYIDSGFHGWKKSLYDAQMAYGTKEIWAAVPNDPMINADTLKALGFTIDEDNSPGDGSERVVKGPKTALRMSGFISTREGEDRIRNTDLAAGMAQLTQAVLADPISRMALGSEQIIDIYNAIAGLSGLPRDFRLHVANQEMVKQMETAQGGGGQNEDQMRQMLEQLTQQILQATQQQTGQILEQTLTPVAQKVEQNSQSIVAVAQQIPELGKNIEQIRAGLAAIIQAASATNEGGQNAGGQPGAKPANQPRSIGRV